MNRFAGFKQYFLQPSQPDIGVLCNRFPMNGVAGKVGTSLPNCNVLTITTEKRVCDDGWRGSNSCRCPPPAARRPASANQQKAILFIYNSDSDTIYRSRDFAQLVAALAHIEELGPGEKDVIVAASLPAPCRSSVRNQSMTWTVTSNRGPR